MIKVMTLFGTRPEVIKLAPVIWELERDPHCFETVNIASGQHTTLLHPFVRFFDIRLDHDLHVMRPGQSPNGVCSRVLALIDPLLVSERPDLVLVQGDTTTAMAGAVAAFHRDIPVGHVEAGLRSGNLRSPFPEEMNRRVISRVATLHFAATAGNRETLLREGVPESHVFVTGNPVVDALHSVLARTRVSPLVERLLQGTQNSRRIILTTHRRESFGEAMIQNLRVLGRFVESHQDATLLFPVHPNPVVVEATRAALPVHPRIHLIEPLEYADFITLLAHAALIVSDSGGVQEEAPTLGRPLIILRENTERPEAVVSGIARLVGPETNRLGNLLEEAWAPHSWAAQACRIANPFGRGDTGRRITSIISSHITATARRQNESATLTEPPDASASGLSHVAHVL